MTMTSQDVVTVYEEMVVITEQMVQAASASDWDMLVTLERQCAAHLRNLTENEQRVALVGASRTRKVDAIRKMLADDRKIRDLTMPWMAKLSALISNSGAERRLARAYGA